MTLEAFAAEMAARGCAPAGKNFCGVYQGWPFVAGYLNGTPGGKTVFSLNVQMNDKVPNAMFKALRQQMKDAAPSYGTPLKLQRPLQGSLLSLTVTAPADAEFGRAFDTLLTAVTGMPANFGLTLPGACPLCKRGGCDSYTLHGTAYVPVHDACVRGTAQNKVAKAYDNERSGSYGLGILGAVLGGLVGAIPTILLAVFAERISGWLCALIPLGAYYGYKLLRGRMNTAALITTIATSALLCPVAFYLTQEFVIYREFGEFLGLSVFFQLMAEYPGDIVPAFLQMLLFVALGVFIVFGIVSRGNKHVVQEAGVSIATLRPMGAPVPFAAPAAPAGGPIGERLTTDG